jgi:two-component system phosphate regulon response regulator PhoB
VALLEKAGYYVDSAGTEEEAVKLAKMNLPDFVMLDVHLDSGKTGISICERLRATPRMERVPIMMLSSDSARETVVRCIAAGANDYYLKGAFNIETLLARIQKWIGGPEAESQPEPGF